VVVDDVGADAIAQRVEATIADAARELSIKQADELTRDAGQMLRAWLGGTGVDYLAYLSRRGYAPPPAPLWEDPESADAAWPHATETFRGAEVATDAVSIRAEYDAGEPVGTVEGTMETHAWRFDKIDGMRAVPTDAAIARAKLTIYEVVVPMRMLADGTLFDGRLGMAYAWDDARRAWALVRVSIYDYPNGTGVVLPPF
jgi:hypothetical protein